MGTDRRQDIGACRSLANRIRTHALQMASTGGGSHIGSVFSCADILAVLYAVVLRYDPEQPDCQYRDRFVLSKGHACAGLYAALAEQGFFDVATLTSHYQNGSVLCGHASHQVPGVEVSTGALGHGLSIACGMAFAAKLAGAGHRVFSLLSDGECDEGSVWEAALFASQHKLDNLTIIIDYNRLQGLARVADVLELEPLREKWSSFGWSAREVLGHDFGALSEELLSVPFVNGRPNCLIADTVKGKGVSFMENSVLWHYRVPRGEELDAAVAELEAEL
jgi:transketolase